MPEKETIERAQEDAREGKAPTTQAGEFVREEIHHVREGKHGVKNTKQAIAIGLSKARKAGVKLPSPPKGTASSQKENRKHRSTRQNRPSAKRSLARKQVLKRQSRLAASHRGEAFVSLRATIAMTILLSAVIASAIGVVYSIQQSRELFVELTKLGNERDDLNFEFGRLELEQATWAENNRIDQIARGRLGMVSPNPAATVVIRR